MRKNSNKPKAVKRHVSGIFLLDKATGLSSNAAMQQVRRLYCAAKAGHTGALDPMATGLLPVCLGEATKFSKYLLLGDKAYEATLAFGAQTDTGDAEGRVLETKAIPSLTFEQVERVLAQFVGDQAQIPPMYSALKKDGKKLYELARAGTEVVRQPRHICIHNLALMSLEAHCIRFQVRCSKGTYIRVLGEDIAKQLGTLGHLTALRRTHAGVFSLIDAKPFDDIKSMSVSQLDALLLPSYAGIEHFSKVRLTPVQAQRVRLGQRLNIHEQASALQLEQTTEVLLFSQACFLGLAELAPSGRLQPKRLVQFSTGEHL